MIKPITAFFKSRKFGDGEDLSNCLLICSACDEDFDYQLKASLKISNMPGYSNDQKKEILAMLVSLTDLPFTMSQCFQSALIDDDRKNSGMCHIKAKLNDIAANVHFRMKLEDINLNDQPLLGADYEVYAENIIVKEKMLPGNLRRFLNVFFQVLFLARFSTIQFRAGKNAAITSFSGVLEFSQ